MSEAVSMRTAEALVTCALEACPTLGHSGFAPYGGLLLEEDRALLSDSLGEVAAAAEWLRRQKRTKRVNQAQSSYAYARLAEDHFSRQGVAQRVSNGPMIAAAVGLGFVVRPISPRTRSAYINLSQDCMRRGA